MIQRTVSSLSICFISLLNILRKVRLRLVKIQRDSIGRQVWGGKDAFCEMIDCLEGNE